MANPSEAIRHFVDYVTSLVVPPNEQPEKPQYFYIKKWVILISTALSMYYYLLIIMLMGFLFHVIAKSESTSEYWTFLITWSLVIASMIGEAYGCGAAYKHNLLHTKYYIAYCIFQNVFTLVRLVFFGKVTAFVGKDLLGASLVQSYMNGSFWCFVQSLLSTGLAVWFMFDLNQIEAQTATVVSTNNRVDEEPADSVYVATTSTNVSQVQPNEPEKPRFFNVKKWIIIIITVLSMINLSIVTVLLVFVLHMIAAEQFLTTAFKSIFIIWLLMVMSITGEQFGFKGAYRENLLHAKCYAIYCITQNVFILVRMALGKSFPSVSKDSVAGYILTYVEIYLSGSIWAFILSLLATGLAVWFVLDLRQIEASKIASSNDNAINKQAEKLIASTNCVEP